jgi:hypothetical protein
MSSARALPLAVWPEGLGAKVFIGDALDSSGAIAYSVHDSQARPRSGDGQSPVRKLGGRRPRHREWLEQLVGWRPPTMLSLLLQQGTSAPFFWGFMGAAAALIFASESTR